MNRNLSGARSRGLFARGNALQLTRHSPKNRAASLRVAHFDSPASMSLLEELTTAAIRPMMGVFNNLVVYDQHVPQNSMKSIVPDLATSWSWNEEGTELTFPLRQGVKWHDGKPFTATGREMHLGSADGQVHREAAHQSAQVLVRQSR